MHQVCWTSTCIRGGHYGSANATTVQLLDALMPELAIISVGKWDHGRPNIPFTTFSYGHPRRKIVDLLSLSISNSRPTKKVKVFYAAKRDENYNLTDSIYSTLWDGNILVKARIDGQLSVTTDAVSIDR